MGIRSPYDRDRFESAYDKVMAKWPEDREAVTVPTPFGETYVNVCGPADGRPLVLLPGGGGATSASWYAQAADLAGAGHRVHAVDLIGAPGRSVPVVGRRPRTVADLTAWLDAVLDGLGASVVDLGGHSYGGWFALHYALRPPGYAVCSSSTRPSASPGSRRRTCCTHCRCCYGPLRAASARSWRGRPGECRWTPTGCASRRRARGSRPRSR